jgi:hypothetical protein
MASEPTSSAPIARTLEPLRHDFGSRYKPIPATVRKTANAINWNEFEPVAARQSDAKFIALGYRSKVNSLSKR